MRPVTAWALAKRINQRLEAAARDRRAVLAKLEDGGAPAAGAGRMTSNGLEPAQEPAVIVTYEGRRFALAAPAALPRHRGVVLIVLRPDGTVASVEPIGAGAVARADAETLDAVIRDEQRTAGGRCRVVLGFEVRGEDAALH